VLETGVLGILSGRKKKTKKSYIGSGVNGDKNNALVESKAVRILGLSKLKSRAN
jgi:hypothetical protein